MGKPLRVLIIEDSEPDAFLLLHKLSGEGGYDPIVEERICTLRQLQQALEKPWDIIISDHSMPQLSAYQALEELRARNLDIPVIIVSGTIEPRAAVAAMKAGASDYIMKDDTTRLLPAIERELREARHREEKRKAEEQLRQAQKMESVGQLAGGIAHDFNNLLTAILGSASFLAAGPEKHPEWRDDVEEIKKAAHRAAALTKQLLAFSRRQVLQLRTFDINAEILDIEKMLRRMVGEDIQWTTSLSSDECVIKADSGQVQQVIMNLVVNARDAMPDGGKLTVATNTVHYGSPHQEAEVVLPPGDYVVLSVSDTGSGMDANVKAHIFEPFFTTKAKGRGTGLGLAVVYGIVKQSGGFIVIDSALSKGTTFRIYFPAAKGPIEPKNEGHAVKRSLTGKETILIVDDDESVRVMIRRVLRQYGYAVIEAGQGSDALKICDAHVGTLNLLLSDIVLPDINGVEVARQISTRHPEVKVVLMSGYLDRDFGNFCLDARIPFLQKPFSPDGLGRIVRDTLDSGGTVTT